MRKVWSLVTSEPVEPLERGVDKVESSKLEVEGEEGEATEGTCPVSGSPLRADEAANGGLPSKVTKMVLVAVALLP